MLCWCIENHIIVDLVHVDVIGYIFNPVQRQGILNRMKPCLPYPSFLRVRKPGSSTHPYYFRWDFGLRKQVTTERASSIGVCWQTLHTKPGSGPLKPTNGSIVGIGRSLRKVSGNDIRDLTQRWMSATLGESTTWSGKYYRTSQVEDRSARNSPRWAPTQDLSVIPMLGFIK